ncbi:MAG: PQQ-binding-like beta-propeller repeat protein [Planctomycetes bacterium]|nr:PQQ-binding-like beta-propeller repeat protein [Planctomycetota bacterium]
MPVDLENLFPSLVAVLPLLPAAGSLLATLLAAMGGALAGGAILRPAVFAKLARGLARQYRGLLVLTALACFIWGLWQLLPVASALPAVGDHRLSEGIWPMFRGHPGRTGHVDSIPGPRRGGVRWRNNRDLTFYSTPAVLGNSVLAVGFKGDSARLLSWDLSTGSQHWNLTPPGHRATFSSLVADHEWLICGEGFHSTPNCALLGLLRHGETPPQQVFRFSTRGHIEGTPIIADRKVYFSAGDDGIYCLGLPTVSGTQPELIWHVPGDRFPDAETALLLHGDRLFAGLGFGGQCVSILAADSGAELARLPMPYPVFSPPAIHDSRLFIGMGTADYSPGADPGRGEVRCINLQSLETEWKLPAAASVVSAMVVTENEVLWTTVSGSLEIASLEGKHRRTWKAGARCLTAPAVTPEMIYVVTCDGRITGLSRDSLETLWTATLGEPGEYISSPVVCHGHIFVGTPHDGFVSVGEPLAGVDSPDASALSRGTTHADGSVIASAYGLSWTWHMPESEEKLECAGPPLITETELLVTWNSAHRGKLVCLDFRGSPPQRPRWTWRYSHRAVVPPQVAGDEIVCMDTPPGGAGHLIALDRSTGNERWRTELAAAGTSLSVEDDAIFVSSTDGALARCSSLGQWEWHVSAGSIEFPVQVVGNLVIAVASRPDRLQALDSLTGERLWQVDLPAAPLAAPLVVHDRIFVSLNSGLQVRSIFNGQEIVASRSPTETLRTGHSPWTLPAAEGVYWGESSRVFQLGQITEILPGSNLAVGANGAVFVNRAGHLTHQSSVGTARVALDVSGVPPLAGPLSLELRQGMIYVCQQQGTIWCLAPRRPQ